MTTEARTVRVFKHKTLIKSLTEQEITALVKDFKKYKETGVIPELFGRDELYDHPNTLPVVKNEEVAHIHLASSDKPFLNSIQFYRTSDTHLIYCQGGIDESCYLLIAILSPSAHEQAKDRTIMFNLGRIAEKFRQKF